MIRQLRANAAARRNTLSLPSIGPHALPHAMGSGHVSRDSGTLAVRDDDTPLPLALLVVIRDRKTDLPGKSWQHTGLLVRHASIRQARRDAWDVRQSQARARRRNRCTGGEVRGVQALAPRQKEPTASRQGSMCEGELPCLAIRALGARREPLSGSGAKRRSYRLTVLLWAAATGSMTQASSQNMKSFQIVSSIHGACRRSGTEI